MNRTTAFLWILGSGLAMSAVALVGLLTLYVNERRLRRWLLPLVALAAGSLLGGALFHMLPAAVDRMGNTLQVYVSLVLGFIVFYVLEQFLHWHHCHRVTSGHKQVPTYLVLFADTLHNFIGGLAVGATFMSDIHLGVVAWVVAAAHEIPQELGDFGVLVHGGWSPRDALFFNALSALTFPLGGLVTFAASAHIQIDWLLPFAAGNFLYIAAVDLVPEIVRAKGAKRAVTQFCFFALGLGALGALAAFS